MKFVGSFFKKNILGRKFLIISLIVVAFFVVGISVLNTIRSGDEGLLQEVNSKEYGTWDKRIKEVGGSKSFDELVKSAQELSSGLQHEKAHLFGGALYRQEGAAGLTVCDDRFNYGCFHEFLGTAVSEMGISSIESLNSACIEYLGDDAAFCQHGVGHGIQSYFGYSEDNLVEALALCRTLPANDPIGGCAGGIFMEYNFRTMISVDDTDRPFKESEVFEPCVNLSDEGRISCSYWQPQWWHQEQFSDKSDIETFRVLGKQCRGMFSDKELQENCFRGIGNVIPAIKDITVKRTEDLCVAVSMGDKEIRALCVDTAIERVINNLSL